MTPPDLSPQEGIHCPTGDRCQYQDSPQSFPSPYTYSDFTGFGLRNFTRPRGSYSYVVAGCTTGGPNTRWMSVVWSGETPPSTALAVRARSGPTAQPDVSWGQWTTAATVSPTDLSVPLKPNLKDDHFLQIQFEFSTTDKQVSPKLTGFHVLYQCANGSG